MLKTKVFPPFFIPQTAAALSLINIGIAHFKQHVFLGEVVIPFGFSFFADDNISQLALSDKQLLQNSGNFIEQLKQEGYSNLAARRNGAFSVCYDAFVLDEDGVDRDALVIFVAETNGRKTQHHYPYVLSGREIVFGESWSIVIKHSDQPG